MVKTMVGVEDLPSGDQRWQTGFPPRSEWSTELIGGGVLGAMGILIHTIYIIYIYITNSKNNIYIYMYMCTIATKDLTMRDDASFL